MACAFDGPIPGNLSNSSALAVLMSTVSPGARWLLEVEGLELDGSELDDRSVDDGVADGSVDSWLPEADGSELGDSSVGDRAVDGSADELPALA